MKSNSFSRTLLILAALIVAPVALSSDALAAAADLDPTFDGDGKVTTDFFGSSDVAHSVAVQPDGKIVAAGYADNQFALVRYNADGSLDTTFDGDGKVTTDFFGGHNVASSVAVQPDGRIVAAGYAHNPSAGRYDFALVRYNADGSVDTTFDGDGKVDTGFLGNHAFAYSVAVQPDGKIVAAGYIYKLDGSQTQFALARYNADGSVDASFGGDGQVTTGVLDQALSVVLQPDGKIVAVGTTYNLSSSRNEFALARYNADGSVDTTFGDNGRVSTDFFGNHALAYSVAVQPDGKIVAAGYTYNSSTNVVEFALARYNADGSVDTTFDGDGKVTTGFFLSGNTDVVISALCVALQPDGKIIAAGYTYNPSVGHHEFALARYEGDVSVQVAIDIRPGSVSNSVNPKSKGKIPVAIISTASFDAVAAVNSASLTFGRTGDEQSWAFCNAGGEDVDGDGRLDLVCHFLAQVAGFLSDDVEGVLKGETTTGNPLIGTDSVRIKRVPPRRR